MSTQRYQWNRHLVAQRKIGSESVLIPIAREAGNLNSFFQMNNTATVVWEGAVEGKTLQEIATGLAEAFDVSAEQAEQDTSALLEEFVGLGALSPMDTGN